MITKGLDRNYAIWWRTAGIVISIALLIRVALGVWNTFGSQTTTNPTPSPWTEGVQRNEGGQVTVTATFEDTGAAPAFKITMETHAVDLDGYELTKLAVLRTDQGRLVQPLGWDAPKGGHHREGTLTFPATTTDGSPIITSNTQRVDLIIRNVADVPERTLTWKR